MKAFEKYNSTFSTPKQQKDDPIKSLLTRTRQETWRAALEWARDQPGWEREDITQPIEDELEERR